MLGLYRDEQLKQEEERMNDAQERLCGNAEVKIEFPKMYVQPECDGEDDEKRLPLSSTDLFFKEVYRIVSSDRTKQYGEGMANMQRIADMWGLYLGIPITTEDVAIMMVLHKASRIAQKRRGKSGNTHDSWVDIAGYACLGDFENRVSANISSGEK